jgi:hypothetical protein
VLVVAVLCLFSQNPNARGSLADAVSGLDGIVVVTVSGIIDHAASDKRKRSITIPTSPSPARPLLATALGQKEARFTSLPAK